MSDQEQVITIDTRFGDRLVFSGDNLDIKEHMLGWYVVVDIRTGERVWTETIKDGRRGVTKVSISNYKHAKKTEGDDA